MKRSIPGAAALAILCAPPPVAASEQPLTTEALHALVLEQQRQLEIQQRQIDELRRLVLTAQPPSAATPTAARPVAPRTAAQPAVASRSEKPAATTPTAPPRPKPADDAVRVSLKNGLRFESPDGDFRLRLGGRLHLDAAWYDQDRRDFGDGAELRRARIAVSGTLYDDWRFRASYDFADNDVSVKDAWIRYSGLDWIDFQAGQYQEPFSLEELTSSNYITFMERALPNALVPSYHLGAGARAYGDAWSATAGLFGETIGRRSDDRRDDGWGLAGRATFAPWHQTGRVAHLGASLEYREPEDAGLVRYRSPPETHVAQTRLVDTDDIANVDHTWKYGLEAAAVLGRFSLQGEYIRSRLSRDLGSRLVFDGWYLYGSWFISGESRRYSVRNGVFRGIRPRHRYGAWELALRYSALDLNDGSVRGGDQNDWTLGLNWYPNRNLRFMANYVWADADPSTAEVRPDALRGVRDAPNLFQVRAQVLF